MTSERLETEVAIVGAGPVGLGLAIELGQRGIDCVVIERHTQPQLIPKGQNLTQRTMEHFHAWGAEARVRAARTIPPEYGIGGMTSYGSLLGEHRYDWLQRELVRPYYFTDNERLPQYAAETVLRARAAELPHVKLLFGWTADGLEQDDAGVTVTAAERDTGRRVAVRAVYAAGCDGSRSLMREAAGITETRTDHDRLMVLLVFRSRALHDLLARYPGKSFYNVLHPDLEGYWLFFGRVDLGETWFFHAPVPLGTTRENFDFDAYLHKAVGADFDMALDHVGFWELRIALADTYRAGRVFIAGDAAHSHPPYGGYGVNTGLEDARNLGWKLAAALRGWAGEGLLDSYEAERRPVFASTARDFIEKAIASDRDFLAAFDPARDRTAFERHWAERGSGARDEVGAFEPHYEGSPVVFGPPGGVSSADGRHEFTARAGHHLAPQLLSDGRNVFEALGPGFTLLAFDADPSPFAAEAARLGLPLTIVTDSRADGRAAYGAALVLIRPDHFVAWAGEAGADPAAILVRAAGFQSNG